jgi:hypothetical protein
MQPRTQDVPGYYVWQVSGQPVVVHIRLDLIDRLAAEVMRGFGAIPKRGAEVGGVLLGTMRPGSPSIVRIEDFEPVACHYRRGPSYLFTEDDSAALEQAFERWKPDPSRPLQAVGYFRSDTRDGFSLGHEDIALLDHFFPSPAHVALLVKPYASKVSVGGFFVRHEGVFPESTPLEFPFRSRELSGEEPPPPIFLDRPPAAMDRAPASADWDELISGDDLVSGDSAPAKRRFGNWVWIPISFMFLLLGGALGYEVAVTIASRGNAGSSPDYSPSLSVTKSGGNLSVKWDGQSVAVRSAQRGLLEIDDSGYTKSVQLDAAQLQNGTLIYRNSTNTVHFRLTVYPRARLSIVETTDWKE